MSALSQFLANELLDHVLRNESYSPPSSIWIALFTADDGLETNVQTSEVSGGAYARLEVGGASGRSFSVAAGSANTNNEVWEFAEASASWGTITHVAIMSAAFTGEVLFHKALASAVNINNGDTARFQTGDFDVQAL